MWVVEKNNNISLNNSSGRLGINSSTWDCASYDQHLYIPGGHPHALHQSDANCGCMHRHIACLVPTVFGWRFVFLTKKKKRKIIFCLCFTHLLGLCNLLICLVQLMPNWRVSPLFWWQDARYMYASYAYVSSLGATCPCMFVGKKWTPKIALFIHSKAQQSLMPVAYTVIIYMYINVTC